MSHALVVQVNPLMTERQSDLPALNLHTSLLCVYDAALLPSQTECSTSWERSA